MLRVTKMFACTKRNEKLFCPVKNDVLFKIPHPVSSWKLFCFVPNNFSDKLLRLTSFLSLGNRFYNNKDLLQVFRSNSKRCYAMEKVFVFRYLYRVEKRKQRKSAWIWDNSFSFNSIWLCGNHEKVSKMA